MEICRKWREKAFELTERLAIVNQNYNNLVNEVKQNSSVLFAEKQKVNELLKQKDEDIENIQIEISTLDSVISQHKKSLQDLTQVLETGNKFLLPVIETNAKHYEKLSQLITTDEILKKFDEKIDLNKISQMKHLVDLLTIISKRKKELSNKKKVVDQRSDYISTLEELQKLQNDKYRLGLQWSAIEKEIQEDKEEQERLEELKQEYTNLLQKDKAEISEKQNSLAPIYEESKEKRDDALTKQRELERRVNEAQKRFEETRQNKQEQIDELSKHVAEQKVEIAQLKDKIEQAKAEISKFVDEGIQSDPPKSAIFPSLNIEKDLFDLPNKIVSSYADSQAQTQSQAIPIMQQIQMPQITIPQQPLSSTGADDNSHYKSCLDQINFLLQQAQNLSVDQDFENKNQK